MSIYISRLSVKSLTQMNHYIHLVNPSPGLSAREKASSVEKPGRSDEEREREKADIQGERINTFHA
jgi:hypothetical protein